MTVFKFVDKINRQLCFQKRGKLHVKYAHCNISFKFTNLKFQKRDRRKEPEVLEFADVFYISD